MINTMRFGISIAGAVVCCSFGIATAQTELKINEVYFTGSFAGNLLQANDQFVELYNASRTKTQYLDGMMIVRFSSVGRVITGALNSQGMLGYKFPGAPGGHQYPVSPGGFVVIARNAEDFRSNSGLNLSSADWECYAGLLDKDNAAPNLNPVGGGFLAQDFIMNATNGAVLLCDGSDTTLSNGIMLQSIVDAVEYHVAAPANKFLPAILDFGWAGAGIHAGLSIERRAAGEDTNNCTIDFINITPTPGYQHGTDAPQSILPDIYPLSLTNYKLYDEYTVDTNNVRSDGSLHPYSTIVLDTAARQGGLSCGLQVDSTFNTNGAATTTQKYLRNINGIGVDQFADGAFWSAALGPIGAVLGLGPQWVTLFKGNAGLRTSYPMATIDTTVTYNGLPITSSISLTGKWDGVETITVPAGTFACYVFKITVHSTASATLLIQKVTLFDNTLVQTVWLARGVGVVKFVSPSNTIAINIPGLFNQSFPQTGIERDLRAAGRPNEIFSSTGIPSRLFLDPLFPNPASALSQIRFGLATAGRATLRVMDVLGNVVKTLIDAPCLPGIITAPFDASGLNTGSYFLQLQTQSGTRARTISIIR